MRNVKGVLNELLYEYRGKVIEEWENNLGSELSDRVRKDMTEKIVVVLKKNNILLFTITLLPLILQDLVF